MTSELARLADLRATRVRLDEQELELIDRARYGGATWAQVAAALGLASRQAAEQRRQRLAAARSARRRSLDLHYPEAIATIRSAVSDLRRWIDTDRRWDSRFRRAELVRRTAEAALDAPPGSLYALALLIAADLAEAGRDRLPAPVRTVAAALDAALSTAH
ncbi:hypothetical protein DLJ47_07500 [Micromonospora sp. S4605]|uniref:hypothetical protein n=1 Tax=Micromonospora sp. S4605 TaxID=1420897 RepID=UPI000D6EFA13|nr:hypothetical protein [Micromonospora sp. S4605]PWU56082.1 hypothetical protein DLJ47_07500 [Micromonospora sp. S4605]